MQLCEVPGPNRTRRRSRRGSGDQDGRAVARPKMLDGPSSLRTRDEKIRTLVSSEEEAIRFSQKGDQAIFLMGLEWASISQMGTVWQIRIRATNDSLPCRCSPACEYPKSWSACRTLPSQTDSGSSGSGKSTWWDRRGFRVSTGLERSASTHRSNVFFARVPPNHARGVCAAIQQIAVAPHSDVGQAFGLIPVQHPKRERCSHPRHLAVGFQIPDCKGWGSRNRG